MSISNRDRVGKALELLNTGLRPFMEREMKAAFQDRWLETARQGLRDDRNIPEDFGDWDTQALVTVLLDQWNVVYNKQLGPAERNMVHEIRGIRNSWAHQQNFSSDDAYRALDTIGRLLSAVAAPEQAAEVERERMELMRQRFEEQSRRERRKASALAVEGTPAAGFKPWREVVTPHPDVASGRLQQAEFAADLGLVHRGEGPDEYRDPKEFFRRTYLTEGLSELLSNALRRLNDDGGDPVVELQTNFGGGKTHSMLALLHLFSGTPAADLPGLEPVLERAGGAQPIKANRAVLVGTALSPVESRTKPDGTVTRTLWGEMAWQLLGKEGYAMVADADQRGVSPGSDTLRELFTAAAPCIVLIDEWVAFLRNMYQVDGLPAGSFEANLTFAQALTEAAKLAPRTLVVATIPESDIEVGGTGGQAALERIQKTFSRVAAPWRPASTEESFEIVRRRLFQPIDHENAPMRDAVIRAFCDLYRKQSAEFPSNAREADYERRMRAAYPIHPELFDQLFNSWSSLDRFQRTRGVLRLMATVIHQLWEREDRSLLILPSSVPIDADTVLSGLTHYLEDNWLPVIEHDVDGPQSLPLQQDRENPNLGRYSASRRVARTLFMGSAPTLQMANKGIDDRQIKLGCVQPGESVATFGDALRRLTDRATHLYVDGSRYWFSTQPSVTRMAQDRAARVRDDEVHEEIKRRVREEVARNRGEFVGVHPIPGGSADVPDEHEARLVVLGPEHPHGARNESSPARVEAHDILEHRGNSPRLYRNTLLFLAPDRTRLDELSSAVRQYLAWKSIEAEKDELNLDTFQRNQALTQRDRAQETVKARIPETYIWLLVPTQPEKTGGIEWQEIRLTGSDSIVARASKRACNDELLITRYAGALLRMQLDAIPLWRNGGAHVHVKQLAEDYAQYLYLPRLKDTSVLLRAIEDGVGQFSWEADSFAYAQSYDEAAGRYRGLQAGEVVRVALDSSSVVVKPEVAAAQLAADRAAEAGAAVHAGGGDGVAATTGAGSVRGDGGTVPAGGQGGLFDAGGTGGVQVTDPPTQRRPTRFYGTATLDPKRIGRDAAQIAEEVVQHLTALVGSDVEVTIEIQARVPAGVPENVVRTVLENCRTLKFGSQGFEEE